MLLSRLVLASVSQKQEKYKKTIQNGLPFSGSSLYNIIDTVGISPE
jgi:hypothetical protein